MQCKISDCTDKVKSKGMCVKHYTRFIRYGNSDTVISPRGKAREFFYNLFSENEDGCIRWPFTTHGNPKRPWVSLEGKKRGSVSRFICEIASGINPGPKIHAAHNCGKEWCVNPKHIRWATPKENANDKISHGTVCCGERQGRSKLTDEDVIKIRSLEGKMTNVAIAKMFGVKDMQVGRIIRRERWKHLP